MLKDNEITLKAILPEELSVLFEWINDRDQVLYSAPYNPITLKEHKEWFDKLQISKDSFLFGIYKSKNNQLIGTCQLININQIHRTAELQIRIGDKDHRNRGFGKRAVCLLLKFAFFDLNLNRLSLKVFKTNKRAIKMYSNVGFIEEGILRESAHINGSYVDILIMGILRSEFEQIENNCHSPA